MFERLVINISKAKDKKRNQTFLSVFTLLSELLNPEHTMDVVFENRVLFNNNSFAGWETVHLLPFISL